MLRYVTDVKASVAWDEHETLRGLMLGKLRHMKGITWRDVREVWRKEALGHLKLRMMGKLMKYMSMGSYCVTVKCNWQRRWGLRLEAGMG